MINLEFMNRTVVSDNFSTCVVGLIKMCYLKLRKIYLNRVTDTSVFKIFYSILIEQIYNVIVDEIIVHRLKAQATSKETFEIVSF